MTVLYTKYNAENNALWTIYDKCVTLEHKSSLKSLGYICSSSQQYIVVVKIIHFCFMLKIIRILSKDHVPWRYLVNFLKLQLDNFKCLYDWFCGAGSRVVWKSIERFGNLSLEKYGILKWKMCRNPATIYLLFAVYGTNVGLVRFFYDKYFSLKDAIYPVY